MDIICAECKKLIATGVPVEVAETIRYEGNCEYKMNYVDETGKTKELHCLIYDENFYCLDCLANGTFYICAKCGSLENAEEDGYGLDIDLCTGEKKCYCISCYDELFEE